MNGARNDEKFKVTMNGAVNRLRIREEYLCGCIHNTPTPGWVKYASYNAAL
jgi:hypothetical protein